MTREEFDEIVQALQTSASRKPKLFKFRVGALATLGFGYLLTILTASLACTAGLVFLMIRAPNVLTIKFGIIFGIVTGGLSWAILRGLFVRMESPEGHAISRQQCPELFAEIDSLRTQLNSPAFHRVLLTSDHNAGVVQIPRLGVFGWHRNYLILGLQLLQGVTVEEFRGILAHEFAHLSGSHGKFGAWIYRLRRTWERIFDQLAKQGQGAKILTKFLDWFWPKFNAHAFVLSRVQEYEADRVAARLTSSEAMATGLIRTQVQGRWLDEKYWPDVFAQTKQQERPPEQPFRDLAAGIANLAAHPDASRWLTQAFHIDTNNLDTHPCLKDRLRALPALPDTISHNSPPSSLPEFAGESADTLLGSKREALIDAVTVQWLELIAPAWKERHEATRKLTEELAKLEESGESTVEGLWKKVRVIIDRDGDEKAGDLLAQILAMEPKHAGANFIRGRMLLTSDDATGVEHLEAAMAADQSLTHAACEELYGYFSRTGQKDKLRPLENRLDQHGEVSELANAERSSAGPNDRLLPPELTEAELKSVSTICSGHEGIVAAYVVQKQVQHFPETPMFLVLLRIPTPWWKPRTQRTVLKVVNTVADGIEVRGNWLVFSEEDDRRQLCKKIRETPGSCVYTRAGS